MRSASRRQRLGTAEHAAQQAHASIALVKRTATPPDAGTGAAPFWRDEGFCPVVVTAFARTPVDSESEHIRTIVRNIRTFSDACESSRAPRWN